MRRVKESLHVIAEDNQNPKMFYRRGNWLQVVSVIDEWREMNNWWDSGGEMHFYVVLADNSGVYELCRNERGIWYLIGIFD
jgi:hypothetical protein